ncbi:MAG: DUF6542 domain-containing protein [Jatrophihabitans sp.]
MTGPSSPRGGGWTPQNPRGSDGWGPSTAVRAGSGHRPGRAFDHADDGWTPAGPAPRGQQRTNRVAERHTERSVRELEAERAYLRRAPERGVAWWVALATLIVIAAVGGIIDTIGSLDARGGFNIGLVAASIVAVLIVKRSHLFPIVIAPPIVYSLGAAFQLYLRSNGLSNRRAVFDAAANYLVYGFPAIAAASAAVLIIAGIRLIIRK